ncbi:type 4 pilus major pilin [Rahnella aceris]
MELSRTSQRRPVHRGAITLFEASVYFVVAMLVIAVAVSQGGNLFNTNDSNTEYNNASEIMAKTKATMKTGGIYNFTSAAVMTGAFIQFGGAPTNMQVVGTKSSGSATLQNTWGGAVTLTPVATAGGQKSAFSLTYASVPQEACVTLALKMSVSPGVATTMVNSTSTNGAVAASAVGTQCTADKGSAGQNTLTWTSNT